MTNEASHTRLTGVVVSAHPSGSKYGGRYGEILGTDGKYYVFDSGHVYRNFSFADVGVEVSFEAVAYSYATDIDQIDKHAIRSTSEGT